MISHLRSVLLLGSLALSTAVAQDVDRSRGAIPKSPPLVRWQRNLADAEAVAKATGRPLFLCVNMNFEPASERIAHDRYTNPDFAKLTEGFVCLIASPDRHTPRDHDEHGRRIPCPRFGCVTCGEHIAVEPDMFAKYFKGNRYAPRHMGVPVDGKPLFDIFLTNELSRIDTALQEHGKARTGGPSPFESNVREQEEAAYSAADRARRNKILELAASSQNRPYELIRLGLCDDDPGLRQLARRALVATATPSALGLILETLDDEADRDARKMLVPALVKVADDKPETALAKRVHEAMLRDPKVPVRAAWLKALQSAAVEEPAGTDEDLDARIEELSKEAMAKDAKAATFLALADANLRFARQRQAMGKDPQFLFQDARQAIEKAVAKDGKDTAAHALFAEIAQVTGDRAAAAEHARVALPALLAGGQAATPRAALVLQALAEGASRAIYDAEAKKAEWSGELLAEADAAYAILAAHPQATPALALAHTDLMSFLGLRGCARQAVTAALVRFPADAQLHERFRTLVTQARGVEGLTAAYAELGKSIDDHASLAWFTGFAELVVAESAKRQGDDKTAAAAYPRAVDAFLSSQQQNPGYAESASWYAAMGRAGQARVALDQGDAAAAAKLIAEGIKRMPAVAEREDGLGRTPLFTLKQILAKLVEAGNTDARAELERELAESVPEVWAKASGG
ncbi:MAG: hypothetical protein R3F56_09010 [Planctomycetota bacterium]